MDLGKRRQTLPPSSGLTILNSIQRNMLLDTTPTLTSQQNDSANNIKLNSKYAQKLGANTVASQLSMINTSISFLSSSLTTTVEPLSRKLDDLGESLNYLPALQTQITTVCDGFRELDSLVRTQNSQLVELQSKQCDLMEENNKLKSKLNNFENNIHTIIHDNLTKLESKITEKILSKLKKFEGNFLEEFQSIDKNFGNLTTGMATVMETV